MSRAHIRRSEVRSQEGRRRVGGETRGGGRTADDEEGLDDGAHDEDAQRDAVPQRPEDRDSGFEVREGSFIRMPAVSMGELGYSRTRADDQTCEHAREAA